MKSEGAGKSRVPAAPAASCAKCRKNTSSHHRFTGTPGLPCTMVLTVSFVLLCPKNLPECANGRFSTNRPSLDLSPFVLKGCEPDGEPGTDPVSSSTRTVARASSPNRARKGVDDGTKRSRCRGYRCRQGQGGFVHSRACIAADVPQHRTGPPQAGWLASQAPSWQGGDGGKWRLRARLGQVVARGRH